MPDAMLDNMLDAGALKKIAEQYLPSRWHYHYALSKLKTDPLYGAVTAALSGTDAPLLDLGCGIGLLPHYYTAAGLSLPYLGVDNDGPKVRLAREAARRGGLKETRFDTLNLATSFPTHRGSVAILDMLQFVPPERVSSLVTQAAHCVEPAGRLIIRTGLQDGSRRFRVTRAADVLARTIRWMNAAPRVYPTMAGLKALLEPEGLEATFTPLWGNTPFNNWLVIARR